MRSETMAEHINSQQKLTASLLHFVSYTTLCFILFSLILSFSYCQADHPSDQLLIRTGLLRDLAAEQPIGRQALFSSLSAMPLSSLSALPFMLFLKPAAFGFAYLYGIAALLALSAMPLRRVLSLIGLRRLQVAAPFILAVAAFMLGPTEWIDLLACLPMLILAIYFESMELPELRALSGIFWALTIFAHIAGAFLCGIWLIWVLVRRMSRKCTPETRAVQWIQGVSILYAFGVYMFLNWMIMGSPAYPFATATWSHSSGNTAEYRKQLSRILIRQYSDCRPVVSGLWGYAVSPLLNSTDGYHFIDFSPGKLPADETGDVVLVIPAGGNPFARLTDMKLDASYIKRNLISPRNCKRTDSWIFVRIDAAPAQPQR